MKAKLVSAISLLCISATLSYAQSDRAKIAMMQQQLDQLSERVEGLTTVIEGLNSTINDLSVANKPSATSPTSLVALESKVDRIDRECVKRDKKVTKQGTKRATKIDKPRDSSRSRDDEATTQDGIENKNNSTLYSEGARFFQKQQYQKAEDRFKLMVERDYKKASSNYYLGEIAYYTKNYSDAIHYYKKSAKLYDKASYIDILLLHTAISLEKTGDTTQAKIFYDTIISDYPEKRSSKIAKKNLKKLQ